MKSQEQRAGDGGSTAHGNRVSFQTDDAATLGEGAWIGEEDGRLYRSIPGHSLVQVISKQPQVFIRLSQNGYLADEQLRIAAARAGVTPNF